VKEMLIDELRMERVVWFGSSGSAEVNVHSSSTVVEGPWTFD
jgi:hypothetical protein